MCSTHVYVSYFVASKYIYRNDIQVNKIHENPTSLIQYLLSDNKVSAEYT